MNKLLIVLLAVCLFSVVSAHTFVKRDAPTTTPSPTAELTAQLIAFKDQLTKITNDVGKKITESLNPDVINDLITAANKTLESFKPTAAAGEAKPEAAAPQ